ncbi:hypothetical protein ACFE04_015903 [Oxalis oulophora]
MEIFFVVIFIFTFLPNFAKPDVVRGDTISATQVLRDGDTLVSANGTFELVFCSPGSSRLKYLVIRYNQIPEKSIAWLANRQVGINSSSGVLRVGEDGILVVLDDGGRNGTSIWSSNTRRAAVDPVAQLLDSGNLVVRDQYDINPDNYLWQSFDYPGDTGLTGMNFGINKKTGQEHSLSSWKTLDDPSRGNYTYRIDVTGLPQLLLRNDSSIRFRSGPWNGLQFSGAPFSRSNLSDNITYVSNDEELYVTSHVNSSTLTRLYLTPQGLIEWYIWTGTWYLNIAGGMDVCDVYRTCGSYGICDNNNSTICSCLNGFKPRNPREWRIGTWTNGCVRKNELKCFNDRFQKVSGVKVPDTQNSWYNSTMNLDECRRLCLKNCTCSAYGNFDVRKGGSGCLQWFGELIDMKSFPKSEQNIYIRLAASDIAATNGGNTSSSKTLRIIVVVSLSLAVLIIGLVVYVLTRKHRKSSGKPY